MIKNWCAAPFLSESVKWFRFLQKWRNKTDGEMQIRVRTKPEEDRSEYEPGVRSADQAVVNKRCQ